MFSFLDAAQDSCDFVSQECLNPTGNLSGTTVLTSSQILPQTLAHSHRKKSKRKKFLSLYCQLTGGKSGYVCLIFILQRPTEQISLFFLPPFIYNFSKTCRKTAAESLTCTHFCQRHQCPNIVTGSFLPGDMVNVVAFLKIHLHKI